MTKLCGSGMVASSLSEKERQRALYANMIYCEACAENGVKICSWETSSAWQEYVDGKIGESELIERARDDLRKFSETFKKYTVVNEDQSTDAKTAEEAIRRERAKHASRIYRKTCRDAGRNNCFFDSYASWSDYVAGKMSDEEFHAKAVAEVKKMAENPEQ